MTPNRFYIEDASKHDGQIVTVRGWVYNKRSSGKIKFLVLRDGTGLMQGDSLQRRVLGERVRGIRKAHAGILGRSDGQDPQRAPRSGRIRAGRSGSSRSSSVAEPYPISPKEHGVEFLMENRHLWVRSPEAMGGASRARGDHPLDQRVLRRSRLHPLRCADSHPERVRRHVDAVSDALTSTRKRISRSPASSTAKSARWRSAKSTFSARLSARRNPRPASI